jgi:outer membrane lipoprotein-sorting protein
MVWATLAALSGGCGPVKTVKKVPPGAVKPAQEATPAELVETYNRTALAVHSVNATVELRPTAGSAYSGVIEEYHEAKGFLLARRPAEIRVIGQAPVVGKNIFDMVSDGQTFRIFVPSKHKFIVGPAALERTSKKAIENLRPQHLVDAIFWPQITPDETVLFEEFNDQAGRYYILTVLKGGAPLKIARRIWFDRSDLQVARVQTYGPEGKLLGDIRYAAWEPVSATGEAGAAPTAATRFPRDIKVARPRDDYTLAITVTKVRLNEEISADRFKLEQPAGTELVKLGEGDDGAKP